MTKNVAEIVQEYSDLIQACLRDEVSAETFVGEFYRKIQSDERHKGEELFECLDNVFGAAMVFSTDPQLLKQHPDMYIDEQELRGELAKAAEKLSRLLRSSTN